MAPKRPIGTFAISHQLRNDGTIFPIAGLVNRVHELRDPIVASPVCELGPKTSEELYWGEFYDIFILMK